MRQFGHEQTGLGTSGVGHDWVEHEGDLNWVDQWNWVEHLRKEEGSKVDIRSWNTIGVAIKLHPYTYSPDL